MNRVARIETPVGPMLVVARDEIVLAADFTDEPSEVGAEEITATRIRGVTDRLRAFFAGETDAIDAIAVEQPAAPFTARVRAALRAIPAGRTRTYGELAEAAGNPRAARAAGSACANNRVALIVPCHRAVASGGGLGGYRGGLARKRELLAIEREAAGLAVRLSLR